jgi:hypothetical protein
MTPVEAAAALFKMMPQPVTVAQLQEYGIEASESQAQGVSREILSLNLYWILAAVDAHIPHKYRAAITDTLLQTIRTAWWEAGRLGEGSWNEYRKELDERRAKYAYLVDYEGMSHMAVSAEAASLIEDQGILPSEEREKLLVLLIDCAPAAEYGRLLDNVG